MPQKIESLPVLSTKEQIHMALGRGMILLDRIHFTGWQDIEADDYPVLSDVKGHIDIPYKPTADRDNRYLPGELKPYEKAVIIRDALGFERIEEAARTTYAAIITLDRVMQASIDAVSPSAFYEAQDVVRQVWEATRPTEFRD